MLKVCVCVRVRERKRVERFQRFQTTKKKKFFISILLIYILYEDWVVFKPTGDLTFFCSFHFDDWVGLLVEK